MNDVNTVFIAIGICTLIGILPIILRPFRKSIDRLLNSLPSRPYRASGWKNKRPYSTLPKEKVSKP